MQKKIIIVGGHEQPCYLLEHLLRKTEHRVALCIGRADDERVDGVFPSFLKLAEILGVPSIKTQSLKTREIKDHIKEVNPDVVLSLQNNMIFDDEIIDLMQERLGILNIHYAPLPSYGGYWPEMWAIWNNEVEFGVTLHYIDSGIDTGPIVAQKFFPINKDETRFSLYTKSSEVCSELLLDNIESILSEQLDPLIATRDPSYYKKSMPNDGYLDLNWSSEKQSRFIRSIAFPGYPGPKIRIGSNVYTVIESDLPFFAPIQS